MTDRLKTPKEVIADLSSLLRAKVKLVCTTCNSDAVRLEHEPEEDLGGYAGWQAGQYAVVCGACGNRGVFTEHVAA